MMYFEIAYFTILFIIVLIIRKERAFKYLNVKIVIVFAITPYLKQTVTQGVINFVQNIVIHIGMDKMICHIIFFTIAAYLIRKSSRRNRTITYRGIEYTLDCPTPQQYCNKVYTCTTCRKRFAEFVSELDKQSASWQKL